MFELKTDRTILRRVSLLDTNDLHQITGDPEVMRFVGNNKPISLEETRRHIQTSIEHYSAHGCGCFGVVEKESDRLIGYCGFTFKQPQRPELLYGFGKASWGKGIAWETVAAVTNRIRGHYGIKQIIATVDPNNVASVRIIQKLGMRLVESRLDEYGLPEDLYESTYEN